MRTKAWHSRAFSSQSRRSSAAFLLARTHLASFSCRNLLKRTRDSCSSRSFFLRAASRTLKAASCSKGTQLVGAELTSLRGWFSFWLALALLFVLR